MRAGCDDQLAFSINAKTLTQGCGQSPLVTVFANVKFKIAGDEYSFGPDAERAHTFGVRFRLHERQVKIADDALCEASYELITTKGAFRKSPVDDCHRHAPPPALAQ